MPRALPPATVRAAFRTSAAGLRFGIVLFSLFLAGRRFFLLFSLRRGARYRCLAFQLLLMCAASEGGGKMGGYVCGCVCVCVCVEGRAHCTLNGLLARRNLLKGHHNSDEVNWFIHTSPSPLPAFTAPAWCGADAASKMTHAKHTSGGASVQGSCRSPGLECCADPPANEIPALSFTAPKRGPSRVVIRWEGGR